MTRGESRNLRLLSEFCKQNSYSYVREFRRNSVASGSLRRVPFGSEPGYRRPVLVIQSEKENLRNLNTTIVIPLTTNTLLSEYRGNVLILKRDSGLPKDSVALLHQILVVDKFRLVEKICKVAKSILKSIETELDYVLKD